MTFSEHYREFEVFKYRQNTQLALQRLIIPPKILIFKHFKKILIKDITASYDEDITKHGGANFTVKSLLNSKINELFIKVHVSNVFT